MDKESHTGGEWGVRGTPLSPYRLQAIEKIVAPLALLNIKTLFQIISGHILMSNVMLVCMTFLNFWEKKHLNKCGFIGYFSSIAYMLFPHLQNCSMKKLECSEKPKQSSLERNSCK